MIWFEWKKIFMRRLNIIAMLSGYVLVGVCMFSWITETSFYDEKTQTYVEGTDAFQMRRQQAEEQTDIISEEYVTQLIRKIQGYGLDLSDDEAYVEIARPLGNIYYFTAKNYTDMNKTTRDTKLNDIDLSGGAHFYGQRMKKITDYLDMEFSAGNYKEIEKEYWIDKVKEIPTPFRWGDKSVMECIWDLNSAGAYMMFVVVICISSVFASEYETGAAHLLLTTKYGKNRLVWSKIIVSVIFAVMYPAAGILTATGIFGLILGFHGADLPVQLWDTVIPYKLTAWQACAVGFALVLLVSIAMALVLLACSARLRSSITTLVIGATVIIAPAFFPMSSTGRLWNHINYLFPVRVMNTGEVLGAYVSYTAGNIVISYLGMIFLVYTAVCVLSLAAIYGTAVRSVRT